MQVELAKNPALAERYEAHFTPTIHVLTPDGKTQHSSTGYLAPDEYAAFISLGRGKALVARNRFDEAIAALAEVASKWPDTDAAPEALYWQAVAGYKKSQKGESLMEVWARLRERYPGSIWTKKVSFLFESEGGTAKPGTEAREREQREPKR